MSKRESERGRDTPLIEKRRGEGSKKEGREIEREIYTYIYIYRHRKRE